MPRSISWVTCISAGAWSEFNLANVLGNCGVLPLHPDGYKRAALSAAPAPVSTFLLSKDRLITWSLGTLLREARDFRPPPNCSEVVHGSTLVHLTGYPS